MGILKEILKYIGTAQTTSAAYKPTTPYTGGLPSKTVKKGSKGTNVKHVQKFLNWCINAKLKVDGKFGKNTKAATKKFQKQYKLKADGIFGSQSRNKAKKIIAQYAPTPDPAPTPAPAPVVTSKIAEYAIAYAWPYGTASKKYKYSTGSAKAAYKAALKAKMGKKAKISQTDCGYFASTCARMAGHKGFLALPGSYKKSYPKLPSTLKIVQKGGASNLQPGDIIRYKKSSGQHVVIYIGDGKIAHASRKHAFPRIAKSKPWTNANVKKSTIQVIRAK